MLFIYEYCKTQIVRHWVPKIIGTFVEMKQMVEKRNASAREDVEKKMAVLKNLVQFVDKNPIM